MTHKVAIYTRVSLDRGDDETSTQRQEQACRSFADARGWAIAQVYRDSGVSAYDEQVERPDLERMRSDLETGTADMVLVWRSDRLFRRLRLFVNFLHDMEQAGIAYASVTEGFDTTTPAGRFALQMLGAFAEYESASTSMRLRTRRRADAESGRPHRGGRRAFGYERDDVTVVPEEAALLHEAAQRFLNGESLRGIVTDWNDRDIKTTAGNRWAASTLSHSLRNPRYAGYRVHKGDLYPAEWDSIFDEDLHLRLVEALSDSRRRAARRTLARHLLTNLLKCGNCGAPMQSKGEDGRSGKLRYACVPRPERENCGSVTINLEQTEAQVFEDVVEAIDTEALRAASESEDLDNMRAQLEEQLRDDQTALEGLSRDYYIDRILTREEFLATRAPLAERVRQHEVMLAKMRHAKPAPDVPLDDPSALREWWEDEAGIEEKRAFLDTLLEAVVVKPVRYPGYSKWDPDRISYVWNV